MKTEDVVLVAGLAGLGILLYKYLKPSPCGTCDVSCQTTCEGSCETFCEHACQTSCEHSCEVGCQNVCEVACQIDDDAWKHADQEYDVTDIMNRHGRPGVWTLRVFMRDGPISIEKYGPTEPPPRTEEEMIASWEMLVDVHRGYCEKDGNYYWLTYPADLLWSES